MPTTDPAHHASVRRADPLLTDRRPELYAPLAGKAGRFLKKAAQKTLLA